ncbi:ATP-binding protein [Prevotella melaninogenica]|jgi:DNA mismatch repair enzyme|uniref:ATP-binding protein n=1 Tax=Prevotella melaninogenica TaxID=28132 RepID=UPI001C605576|nr:ATP-binding protein [Prevotella melaninogenica]MBW4742104.1 ATP-binding protein [Prevotella melaninogenica]MBW4913212.1 ATP-binding protein [Prevotella melaninogenica]
MKQYNFNISLSVLNHLGRNLYRNFITVLGEAISNSWDADAHNVYITIDRDARILIVRDDGEGMNEDDFQNKFLKIGYSKRKDKSTHTNSGRPYIGRKGIGKLALLSCAQTITVLTKKKGVELVGGIIDNSGLDEAIGNNMSSNEYNLGVPDEGIIASYREQLGEEGTILLFQDLKDSIRNRVEYITKLVALYFRFSLKDPEFNIYINEKLITIEELNSIKNKTQFIWTLNGMEDPYIRDSKFLKSKDISLENNTIKGFIASVEKPSDIKINGTDEKLTIDLYVNGRLREKDILRHIPIARIVQSYLYGQVHFDSLDDDIDRFTSSREGVVPDDPKFKEVLDLLDGVIKTVIDDWDIWRTEINEDGDSENLRMTKKQRKSKELFNVVVEDFRPSEDNNASRKKVDGWIKEIREDAEFNLSSYGECFVSENLLRKYIREKKIAIPKNIQNRLENEWKPKAEKAKESANISFEIREDNSDLSYMDMDSLASLADNETDKIKKASLQRDATEYKPIRDAMSHTSRLTSYAKTRLNATYENIKARIIVLLNRA